MNTKIVVVDDAPFIREVVRQLLKDTDIEVIGEAEDGVEAVKQVIKLKPDLVLMDIVMPQQSGIEATLQIKEELPDVKILACSTMDHEDMIAKAIEAGCSDYIVKPFKAEELINALQNLISS